MLCKMELPRAIAKFSKKIFPVLASPERGPAISNGLQMLHQPSHDPETLPHRPSRVFAHGQRHHEQQQQTNIRLPRLSESAGAAAIESALDAIGIGRFHMFLLLCVSLIWAGDAMEVMVLSYLGPAAACEFQFSATQQSVLSSVVFGGMVLGAASWGLAADALGRRTTLLASCGVVVAGGLASAAAPSYPLLLLSRGCVGFGLAGAPVGFTLMMELLPAASRSTWGTLVELAWTAGTVVEALLAWWLLNAAGWRPLLLASVAPLVLLLMLGQYLPESPRYLLASRKDAGAAEAALAQVALMSGQHLQFDEGDNPSAVARLSEEGVVMSADLFEQESLLAHSKYGGSPASRPPSSEGPASYRQRAATAAQAASGTVDQPVDELSGCRTAPPHCQTDHTYNGVSQQQQPGRQERRRQEQWQWTQQRSRLKSQAQLLMDEVRVSVITLSRPPYASTIGLLLFSWAATSFAYYGLVQLVGELHIDAGHGASGGPTCVQGSLQVPTREYWAVLLTSAAEVPAVAWAAFSIRSKWLGRRRAIALSLGLTGLCLLPCIVVAAAGSSLAAASQTEAWKHDLATSASAAGMFGARLFIMSSFTLLWVFTPEVLPTHVRAFGLGINNACARLGGLLSPFAAINLVAMGAPAAAEGVFAGATIAACVAVLAIDSKHDAEQPMEEEDDIP